jgi:flagellar biosynthesis/type III secretory pathway ATPase
VVSPSVDAEAKPSYVFVPFGSKCIGERVACRQYGDDVGETTVFWCAGRVLDGSGQPIDGKGPLSSLTVRNLCVGFCPAVKIV